MHQIDGHGAWLKVPLGKLATERMVPIDEETLDVDRPDRRPPHPRPAAAAPAHRPPAEFLLIHQGRRISAWRCARNWPAPPQTAGLDKITPHAAQAHLATALVNSGCSLQALMQLLGHVSAKMSLRYGRLFDATVREEYERALTQTKATPRRRAGGTGYLATGDGRPLPLAAITGGADWKDTPTIKSRLAGGFCLRAPAQGSCAYANICEHCPNFRTDTGYLAVLGAQHADALALAADAQARGWGDEAKRHRRLADRLDELISQTRAEAR